MANISPMAVFRSSNLLFHLWAEGVKWVRKCFTAIQFESSANIVSVSENMVILICAMSYLTVLTISSVP